MSVLNLQELRESRRVTQEVVASALGISRCYYSQLETGVRKPSVKVITKMARFFGVSIDTVFCAMGVTSCNMEQADSAD